jgi:hypothetical protein
MVTQPPSRYPDDDPADERYSRPQSLGDHPSTRGQYQGAQPPAAQYPPSPDDRYPSGQFPAPGQYAGDQYASDQSSTGQFPGDQYSGDQFAGRQPRNDHFPEGTFSGGQFSGGTVPVTPGSNGPSVTMPPMNSPTGAMQSFPGHSGVVPHSGDYHDAMPPMNASSSEPSLPDSATARPSQDPEATPPRKLNGWFFMSLGVLALVVGGVWTLQGLDILTDSTMSGVKIWTVIGPPVAVLGLILIITGVRLRTRSKRQPTP